jgi:dihydroflavonol-4-reductase
MPNYYCVGDYMLTAVTGAAGHVGENLVRELVSRGRQVRAIIHRTPLQVQNPLVDNTVSDVSDLASLKQAFSGVEVVYHLAACIPIGQSPRQQVAAVNVEGTSNVVIACREMGVRRLIHFSSIHAFSHLPVDQPVTEERRLVRADEGFLYDRTKAEAERIVLEGVKLGLESVIINPTAIIGPNDFRPSAMGFVIGQIAKGRMRLLVSGGYNWVDVRDVVDGAILAESLGRSGERYILSGHWCSVAQLAKLIQQATGLKRKRIVIPAAMAITAFGGYSWIMKLLGLPTVYTPESVLALQRHQVVRCDKAAKELGYAARPLEETLQDTVQWMRNIQQQSSSP